MKYGVPKRPFVPELIQVCLACTNMKVAYISFTLVFGIIFDIFFFILTINNTLICTPVGCYVQSHPKET